MVRLDCKCSGLFGVSDGLGLSVPDVAVGMLVRRSGVGGKALRGFWASDLEVRAACWVFLGGTPGPDPTPHFEVDHQAPLKQP